MRDSTLTESLDVLIVGAGLSGIAAAYYLGRRCPDKSVAIVEGRAAIGGTWDLFRYPGVRSDSDMYTLGYRFRPWTGDKAIADGPAILQYLKDTAREFGIDKQIRFNQRVRRISWSSKTAEWTVDIERSGEANDLQMRCKFLFMCTATTATIRVIRRTGKVGTAFKARSFTRSNGMRALTAPASALL